MQDPVILAGDGFCYERDAIANWLRRGTRRSPMTGAPLASDALVPNHTLRSAIMEWRERQAARGARGR
jgi:hypothetical protein